MRRRLKHYAARWMPWLTTLRLETASLATPEARRRRRAENAFIRDLARSFAGASEPAGRDRRLSCVLFLSMGMTHLTVVERLLAAAFELAGHRIVMVTPRDRRVRRAFRQLGLRDFAAWGDVCPLPRTTADVAPMLEGVRSCADLMALHHDGLPCGKFALSTAMRQLRHGNPDLSEPHVRAVVAEALARSFDSVAGARALIDRYKPAAVVMVDRGYTPNGEVSGWCALQGVPVYTYNAGHRSHLIVLKRYDRDNQDEHPNALSTKTWQRVRAMPWTEAGAAALAEEVEGSYRKGDWYAEVGTQRHTRLVDRASLLTRLGLDPARKVAGLFPHIFWDATFFWGQDLYPDYETWFRSALKAACANDRLNWVIKVHPANRVKSYRDGHKGEHSEVLTIRDTVGTLPPHVKLLDADTDVSTLSVFDVLDFCLTVRGTVGIECACRGIRVLTAGTGRFDRRGFTHDSDTTEDYLAAVARLETISAMTPAEIDLARRFAYGTFLVRPTRLTSVAYGFQPDEACTPALAFKVPDLAALKAAPDVMAIADWITSGEEDFCDWSEPA